MRAYSVKTPLIKPGDAVLDAFLSARLQLAEASVVAVTSKVVAYEQGRLAPAPDEARFAQLVEAEADGGVVPTPFVKLTVKEHIIIANAGIDLSNAPEGLAILWPDQPWAWAAEFWRQLRERTRLKQLGVVITDSHCMPLRRGVSGVAVAYAGFEGVVSERGKRDLYGRPLRFTERAAADALAATAVFLMGESDESTPFAVIEDAPVAFTERAIAPGETAIDPAIDLFAPLYGDAMHRVVGQRLRERTS